MGRTECEILRSALPIIISMASVSGWWQTILFNGVIRAIQNKLDEECNRHAI